MDRLRAGVDRFASGYGEAMTTTDREPTQLPSARRAPQRREDGDAVLTFCPDGPILVRGDVTLLAADGQPVPRNRPTIALCRCGLSATKPLCDGTHKLAGFRSRD